MIKFDVNKNFKKRAKKPTINVKTLVFIFLYKTNNLLIVNKMKKKICIVNTPMRKNFGYNNSYFIVHTKFLRLD